MTTGITYAGYSPGALANVLRLHTDYCCKHWKFGLRFEVKVASELAEFIGRMDETRDLFLSAYSSDDQLRGSITIDTSQHETNDAHLRWFIVSPDFVGKGIGQELMTRATTHCDQLNIQRVYLTTFAGLDAARNLYDRNGFKLVHVRNNDQWNGGVIEQKFIRRNNVKP